MTEREFVEQYFLHSTTIAFDLCYDEHRNLVRAQTAWRLIEKTYPSNGYVDRPSHL